MSFGLPPKSSHNEIPTGAANACTPVSVASSSLEGAAGVLPSQGDGRNVPESVPHEDCFRTRRQASQRQRVYLLLIFIGVRERGHKQAEYSRRRKCRASLEGEGS